MTRNATFYASIAAFEDFQGICDSSNYHRLPDDWSVVITDIKGSTAAINQGRYREVNALGVASMVAVFNALKPAVIPFVFGGDGAALCIPNDCVDRVVTALQATRSMAEQQFSLSLRVGIVPSSVVHESEYQVLVGKYQVSKGYFQAVFSGSGLEYAEQQVKSGEYNLAPATSLGEVDFSGFECRWKDIPSPHGETLALLVKANVNDALENNKIYLQVLEAVQQIYGEVDRHRPVQKPYLQLTAQVSDLQDEVKIRTVFESRIKRWRYAKVLPWLVRIGRYWMANGKTAIGTDWGEYKDTLVQNTDFRKFDDQLRMVISGCSEQRETLLDLLRQLQQQGLLAFGLHVSDRALMTCVISDYQLHHVHFVDAADGGYAMAARALKKQIQ